MLNFLKVLLFLAVILAIAGYYRGWYSVNTADESVNVAIDSKKIDDDFKKLTDPNKPDEGAASSGKDDQSAPSGKGDQGAAPGKDNRGSMPHKDNRAGTPAKEDRASIPARDERAEGIVMDVAKEMPRFTIRLTDGRFMTFDLAPRAEIRLNDAVSDFRWIRVRSKVVVFYYPEADPMNAAPPKNMARTIAIERAK